MYGFWWPSHHPKPKKTTFQSLHPLPNQNPPGSLDTWPASAQLCRQLFVQSWRLAWTQVTATNPLKGREENRRILPNDQMFQEIEDQWLNSEVKISNIINVIFLFGWDTTSWSKQTVWRWRFSYPAVRGFEWWDLAVFEKNAGSFEEKGLPNLGYANIPSWELTCHLPKVLLSRWFSFSQGGICYFPGE